MSSFTDNQQSSLVDELTVTFDRSPISKWKPNLEYDLDGHSVVVTPERQVSVDGETIEGDWKGRGVASDIAEAVAKALEAADVVKPAEHQDAAKAKAKAEEERAKLLANRPPPPAPPSRGPNIRKNLFVERKPGEMPNVEHS